MSCLFAMLFCFILSLSKLLVVVIDAFVSFFLLPSPQPILFLLVGRDPELGWCGQYLYYFCTIQYSTVQCTNVMYSSGFVSSAPALYWRCCVCSCIQDIVDQTGGSTGTPVPQDHTQTAGMKRGRGELDVMSRGGIPLGFGGMDKQCNW